MEHQNPSQFRRVKGLAPILMRILPPMLAKIGLTMVEIERSDVHSDDHFFFRLKECNPKLHFMVDECMLEVSISHRKEVLDTLGVIGIPWVFKRDGMYFGHWDGTTRYGGPHESVEKLMKCYLPKRLHRWLKRMPPDSVIHMYKEKATGNSWARVVHSRRPAFPAERKYLIAEQKFWVRPQEEP